MRDLDVRKAVHAELCRLHDGDGDTHVVDEMGIWAGTVRVDIAVINGEFHGFELKSARDTLLRLSAQAEIYSQVFDRVTLVVARNHLDKAERMIPEWWGITTVIPTEAGPLRLIEVREACLNPSVNPDTLSRLLWKAELLSILDQYGLAKGFKSKPIDLLAKRLAEGIPLDILRESVRIALKRRPKLTTQGS